MYFVNPTRGTRELMDAQVLGFIDTPAQGNKRPAEALWCMDNGAFSDNWDEQKWWRYLVKNSPFAASCVFAVAPDVVGDAAATLERSRPWLPKIRALGYKAAFAVQDGQEDLPVPWDEFDVLFIGGAKTENPADEWKRGPHARALVSEGKRRGMWVHVGRVNSRKTYRLFQAIGGDSCDGTYLVRGPDTNLRALLGWVREIPLFDFKEPA